MLTARLADLSERGLVEKKRVAGQRREVYVLTPTANSLGVAFGELYRWGEKHADVLGVTVTDPLAHLNWELAGCASGCKWFSLLTSWFVELRASAGTMAAVADSRPLCPDSNRPL